MQVRLCLKRGFQRLQGDMTITLSGVIGNSIMALIISSVFYDLPNNTGSFYSRGALLFFAVLMNAFSSALEVRHSTHQLYMCLHVLQILSLYEQRPIVEKHARMAFYHPASEAIASMITALPAKILSALGVNIVLYFMTNLRREAGAFFIFMLFSFMCTLAMSMVFRTIGSLSRTISQAMAPAAVLILALVIYTGFAIPVVYMVSWLRWINYLNPIAYAFESLMANEFSGREYPCSVFVPSGGQYDSMDMANKICSTPGAEVGSSIVSGSRYLLLTYEYSRTHMWR